MKKRTRITNPFYCGPTVHSYTEHAHKITRPLRAALITDLHSTTYGPYQEILLEAIRRQCPDPILMAGDIADHKVPIDGTLLLLEDLKTGYPRFYISGNHEQWTGEMSTLCKMFTEHGVTVLSGTTARLTLGNQALLIDGVDDPYVYTNSHHAVRLDRRWKEQFWHCYSHTDDHIYFVLLSHWPELTKHYRDSGFDPVVSGHVHGGQVRILGLVNGLLAPHQGLSPLFAGGQYQLDSTSMIVSHGLCLSHIPRIYSPPELVIIDIKPRPIFQSPSM